MRSRGEAIMKGLNRVVCGLVAASMVFGLTGCQMMNENRMATGVGIGAVTGAVAGALIDDNSWRGGAIGAAAGALVGGGIGYVLQKQKESFDRIEELEARQIVVQHVPPPVVVGGPVGAPVQREAIALTMQNEVLFARGSAELTPHGVDKMREIADVMRDYPNADVIIKGHTSNEGSEQENLTLSRTRAERVKDHLIAYQIRAVRIHAVGLGSTEPVADNASESGRMQNRRVEILVIPSEEIV